MSWKASAHVLDLAREHEWLSPTQLILLYALAARHHQDYHCAYGQIPRIIEDTHLGESTISRELGVLEDRAILSVWEGQLPRRRSDPSDRRSTRGLMWCFVGLDPGDGPDMEDVKPHVRVGGRPQKTELLVEQPTFEGELPQNGRSVAPAGVDRLPLEQPDSGDRLLVERTHVKEPAINRLEPVNNRIKPDPPINPPKGKLADASEPAKAREPVPCYLCGKPLDDANRHTLAGEFVPCVQLRRPGDRERKRGIMAADPDLQPGPPLAPDDGALEIAR